MLHGSAPPQFDPSSLAGGPFLGHNRKQVPACQRLV